MHSSPERIAVLETKLEHIERTVCEIRETQLEIRDSLVGARAVGLVAKSGLAIFRAIYPPISAVVAALLAVKYGLPRG